MDAGEFWASLVQAFGLVLVLEGLLPMLWPGGWRSSFTKLLQLSNGQLRFFGLSSIAIGLMLILLISD